jgi:hypothetical protein
VLTVDKHRRPARITLKTIGLHGFDHRATWAAKVRNVSRLGSHPSFAAYWVFHFVSSASGSIVHGSPE